MPDEKIRYRTFKNDEGNQVEFTVFLVHGQSDEWVALDEYIQNQLKFKTVVSVNQFTGGIILQKIKNAVWFECDCAVAILSPDDKLIDGQKNARPNVIFELGYCMGFWDHYYWEDDKLEPVLLVKEKTVVLNSDLNGIEFAEYQNGKIKNCFPKLKQGLERIFQYLDAGNSPKRKIISGTELKQDLKILKAYMADRKIKFISFEKLQQLFDKKFTRQYVMKIVEKFHEQIRIATLSGNRPGIKIL